MRRVLLLLGAALVLAPGSVSPAAVTPCTPSDLHAAMRYIEGSGGAGHLSYGVRLRNTSSSGCTVSGRPALKLRTRYGQPLPTHVVPDHPGTGTAALITLAPGKTAVADARFSPTVGGPGESTTHQCEPTAFFVRVTLASPGSGKLTGKIKPPTPVCEKGRIVLGLLHAA
jgi:hypothetical protein